MVVDDQHLAEVVEGEVRYLVPERYNRRGPGSRGREPFYNRQMEFNRDVCISFLRAVADDGDSILDAMAATGIRAARIAAEVSNSLYITANDTSEAAVGLMEKNFSRLGFDGIRITGRNAKSVMSDERFDFIDIDPFGTPVEFMSAAILSVRSAKYMAVTATDSAMLCGSAHGCTRRYLCRARRWPFMHEIGLRNLTGYIVRTAASYDRAAIPLLSYFTDHYFRIYFRMERGSRKAEQQLNNIGYAHYLPATSERWIDNEPGEDYAGPMWTGSLHDAATLEKMSVESWFGTGDRVSSMLDIWKGEALAPALYYTMDEVASRMRVNMPEREKLLEVLGSKCSTWRTHFDPKGFKTKAGFEEICETIRRMQKG
jgi:tRNA (guanine26-N2/guanine27-N2)-dimethyltransferase